MRIFPKRKKKFSFVVFRNYLIPKKLVRVHIALKGGPYQLLSKNGPFGKIKKKTWPRDRLYIYCKTRFSQPHGVGLINFCMWKNSHTGPCYFFIYLNLIFFVGNWLEVLPHAKFYQSNSMGLRKSSFTVYVESIPGPCFFLNFSKWTIFR